MNLVPRRSKVSRSIFRKIPNGSPYYLSDGTGPFVKLGHHLNAGIDTVPQDDPTVTVVSDNSVAVIKLDQFFRREQS